MDSNDFKDWVVQLTQLTTGQVMDVKRRLLVLFPATQTLESPTNLNINDDWLLNGILTTLRQRGLGATTPPPARIKYLTSFKAYSTNCQFVKALLEEQMPGLSKNELRALGILTARALSHYLESWTEVTLDIMLINIRRAVDALEQAFPGYVTSGMLKHIINKDLTT